MREKILAMEAGRELDALVAEKVMGTKPPRLKGLIFNPPYYSTDISAAWEVFTQFDFPTLEKGHDEEDNDYYVCKISPQYVIADTAPLAICRAALLAVIEP